LEEQDGLLFCVVLCDAAADCTTVLLLSMTLAGRSNEFLNFCMCLLIGVPALLIASLQLLF
jgi:hypothetical protein